MRVLVTGGNGYIGKHVVQELIHKNYEVIVADRNMKYSIRNVEYKCLDIFNDDDHLFEKLGEPDACIHLAWRDGFSHESVNHINDLPLHYRFLSYLVQSGIKKLAIMGTMHEVGYWKGKVDNFTPCNPRTLYGMSKDLLRRLMLKKVAESDTNLYWLRGYYILGDDSNNQSIFTKILQSEENGNKDFPFTSGKNKFDFIEVSELAKQIVAVISQNNYKGIINCCSGKPIALGSCVEEFIHEHKLKIKLKYNEYPERTDESPEMYGDASIIQKILE